MQASDLPAVNASLNALAAVWLILGYKAIKAGKRDTHKKFMGTALLTSAIFLCSYLTYHYLKQGVVTRYEGEGISRVIYFFILGTHTPLAALIVPVSLTAVFHAFRGNFTAHVKIVKWLFPAWLYVSMTGVLIYLMLYVI